MINVRFLNGPPGSGKTTKILHDVAYRPAKYLIAQPRQDLIDETRSALKQILTRSNPLAETVVIHSKESPWPKLPVVSQIEDAPTNYADREHIVLLITHEGLMGSDLSGYVGWNIYIDEVPNSIKSGIVTVSAIAPYLSQIIDLEQIGSTGWSFADLKADAPSQGEVAADTCLREMYEQFKMMRSQRVLCFQTVNFADLKGNFDDLHWFSYWDLSKLGAFNSITVAGAGFKNSILSRVMGNTIQWNEVAVSRPRTGCIDITVKYFTEGHRSSTLFWGRETGQKCLLAIRDYFSRKVNTNFYWSANKTVIPVLRPGMKGREVTPKQEGSNDLTGYDTAVFIYSNKAHPRYDKALCHLAQLSKEEIEQAREQEDIKQFIMRGSIRNVNWSGHYVIYVYDKDQAKMVSDYVKELKLGSPRMEAVWEAQIMDVGRKKAANSTGKVKAAKPKLSDEEFKADEASRKRKKRAAEKEAKIAAGTYKGPGRPKGQ